MVACFSHPTGFWITSPKTSLRNNVAAGGEVCGSNYSNYEINNIIYEIILINNVSLALNVLT